MLGELIEIKLKILSIFVKDSLKNEAGEERLDGGDHDKSAHNQSRKLGDEASLEVGEKDGDEESDRDESEDGGYDAKEAHRTICAVKPKNSEDDF